MKQLLIGDCHFGRYSNSVLWLESQLKFFTTQVVDTLKKYDIEEVVFLGDLFDIRYSICQQVGCEVKEMITMLSNEFPNIRFIFVAGNHDFYTPQEEFHKYNAYDMIFGQEYEKVHPNIKFVVHEPYYDIKNKNLYLPWYYTDNFDNFSQTLLNMKSEQMPVKNIFCHADLQHWEVSERSLVQGMQVWSGHIHYIWQNDNLHNVGSVCALDFNDVNSNRYLYILEDCKIIGRIENVTTPKFKRFKNDEIFDLSEENFSNSYVELWIYSSNINKAKYIERIAEIKKNYVCLGFRTQEIDDTLGETLELSYFNANINDYIEANIPELLKEKYWYIKDQVENKGNE